MIHEYLQQIDLHCVILSHGASFIAMEMAEKNGKCQLQCNFLSFQKTLKQNWFFIIQYMKIHDYVEVHTSTYMKKSTYTVHEHFSTRAMSAYDIAWDKFFV